MNTMRAAVLYGKEDVRIEDVPVPRAGAGEIVIKIGAALTCGTDLKVYRRGYHARMLKPPARFGHELAGTIAETGAGVEQFQTGDHVVALNSAPCDACFFCLRGQQNLCEDLLFNNGAYAEYISIPARIVTKNTLRIPGYVSFAQAALTEPLACCMRAIEESAIAAGDVVAVIGAGPIGLLFIHALALLGAKVIAIVKRAEQQRLARKFGAARVVHADISGGPVEAVRKLTEKARGADVVLDAAAQPLTWQWAVEMARKGGTVNFFGGPPSGTKVELDTNLLHYGDLTLKASFHHTPETARRAFSMICEGRFNAEGFLTGRAPLEQLQPTLHKLMQRTDEIKVVIDPTPTRPA